MLTLRELKKMVEPADERMRVPTVKALQESGVPIVVRELLNDQTEITVFANGYVIYRSGKRMTVFMLHTCGEYLYDVSSGKAQNISEEFFAQGDWYIRLMLEGEDRLAVNQEVQASANQVSYSAENDNWSVLADTSYDMAERLAEQEFIEELLSFITEKQRIAMIRYYIDEESHEEIAADLGISRQAVTDTIAKAIRRIRMRYGITDKRIVSQRHLWRD